MDFAIPYSLLRAAHLGAAFLGLLVFWLPLLARKGGRIHVVCGRIFVVCATATLLSAFIICAWRLIDPIGSLPLELQPSSEQAADVGRLVRLVFGFLGALAYYTSVTLVLAIRVIRTRHDADSLAGFSTRLLVWSQVGVSLALIIYATIAWIENSSEIFSSISIGAGIAGLGTAWWDLRFIKRPQTSPMFWWYKHMEFMLRTGIAFHTAFAVFVVSPWLGRLGSGAWSLVPWVVPPALGLPAIWLWVRHYRRRFGESASTAFLGDGIHAKT